MWNASSWFVWLHLGPYEKLNFHTTQTQDNELQCVSTHTCTVFSHGRGLVWSWSCSFLKVYSNQQWSTVHQKLNIHISQRYHEYSRTIPTLSRVPSRTKDRRTNTCQSSENHLMSWFCSFCNSCLQDHSHTQNWEGENNTCQQSQLVTR